MIQHNDISSPYIPQHAPFTPEQRGWLNGFLAGIFSETSQGSDSETSSPALKLSILFGSQTGNAESLAKQSAKTLKSKNIHAEVIDMEIYDIAKLKNESTLLIIASTFGEGEPPDNAKAFYDAIHSDQTPDLSHLSHSVLALGDSNYEHFCKTGKDIDERLSALGATCIHPRTDADADFDDAYESWITAVTQALQNSSSDTPPEAISDNPPSLNSQSEGDITYDKKNPFPAYNLNNLKLNREGSPKDTRHIEISIQGSGLKYSAGDALGVIPTNDSQYVDELIHALGFSPASIIKTDAASLSLKQALTTRYDVSQLNKKVLQNYNALLESDSLKSIIEDKDTLREYTWGRQLIDLLIDHPYSFSSPDEFVGLLNKLQPRLYSIASSPHVHPDAIHLTVGVVRYQSLNRERKGTCSNYLAEQNPGDGPIPVFVHKNNIFKLPEDKGKAVIMIGPGTGIAPFMGFLQERRATQASGPNWLFFGNPHKDSDFFYQEKLEKAFKEGLLTQFDTAFSRDQDKKIYVQHRMLERSEDLFKWIQEGAYIYVCGDATRMAKDVDNALHTIVAQEGQFTEKEAEDYVKKLKQEKRYLRDVY